ncbi:hypothetical protein DSCA_31030 [Desulfosarcina alkanivorans]|uniref:Uncharacterized protein n=1 Tax=Desulfosarcina alkanivorans TaxID=571177 RepID=A0A5K7YKX2_9BACT|nr:hypothetical protein DSCA_31030 [Desulfosarcina alkanivorans]
MVRLWSAANGIAMFAKAALGTNAQTDRIIRIRRFEGMSAGVTSMLLVNMPISGVAVIGCEPKTKCSGTKSNCGAIFLFRAEGFMIRQHL